MGRSGFLQTRKQRSLDPTRMIRSMSRQQRRRDRRRHIETRNEPVMVDQRPWYFRHGYHVGVWSGASLGVIWFAIFQDFIGLIIGIILGQLVGIFLSRQARDQ